MTLTEVLGALYNTTCWAVGVALAVVLWSWFRARRGAGPPQPARAAVKSLAASKVFLAFVGIGAMLNVGAAIYKGYAVPADILQDIISAQQLLEGKPLYPADMNALIGTALEKEPARFSLVSGSPGLLEKEHEAVNRIKAAPWVQAHPPFMTVLIAPLVAAFGIHGTFLAVSVLSLIALFLVLQLIWRELVAFPVRAFRVAPHPNLPPQGEREQAALAIALAVLGWAPIVDALRAGQPSIILAALLVVGWVCLRRGRPLEAGIAVGIATSIKLFPGLLLVYLLLRERRALAAALVTMLVLFGLPVVIAGLQNYEDYVHTLSGVVTRYGGYFTNISLLGVIMRSLEGLQNRVAVAKAVHVAAGLAIVLAAGWLVQSRRGRGVQPAPERLDSEYALFVALMPLLSPVAWHHYLPILLLPIAVVGRQVWRSGPRWGLLLAFLVLLLALSLPEVVFPLLYGSLHDRWNGILLNLLLISIPCLGLVALSAWLGLACLGAGRRLVDAPAEALQLSLKGA